MTTVLPRTLITRSLRGAAIAAGALAAVVATMPTADAATARNGVCESGEFCYYYGSNETGSVSDFTGSIGNYGSTQPTCYEFIGAGAGQGLCIKNQAASVWNRAAGSTTVYLNSNFSGSSQTFATGVKANLNSTLKNNNASHRIN